MNGMFIFQVVCLAITLGVLQYYVSSGISSSAHRLLPVVLTLNGVYNFYEIFKTLSGEEELFNQLTILLLFQALYLLICYLSEFLHVRLRLRYQVPLFCSLLLADITFFVHSYLGQSLMMVYHFYVAVYTGIIVFIIVYALVKGTFSLQDRKTYWVLCTGILVPSAMLVLAQFGLFSIDVVVPAALEMFVLAYGYLMVDRSLDEVALTLKSSVYDESEEPHVLFDKYFYYLGANSAAYKAYPEEMRKRDSLKQRERYMPQIAELVKEGGQKEVEIRGNFYMITAMPVYTRGNRIRKSHLSGYVVVHHDVTKQRREVLLMESLKILAEGQTIRKGEIMANLSHDLRSPLHTIIGISNILIGKPETTSEDRSLVTSIKSAGNTLLKLVNQILSFSKLEAGGIELEEAPYSLDEVAHELTQMCIVNLGDKDVYFKTEFTTPYPARFMGDMLRVREILQNIMSNAVKYTEKGEIYCTLSTEILEDKAIVHFSCKDTGQGIPEEKIDSIFESYISLSGGTLHEGTGLGLCIVKQLCKLMGGDCTVESGKNGTTFYADFTQGIAEPTMYPEKSYSTDSLKNEKTEFQAQNLPTYVYPEARVLLTDDLEVNRQIFESLTKPWQFTMDYAADGEEAIAAVKKHKYDLIFLDMMMPGMDGIETAARIKEICDVPLVLLTANMSDDLKQKQKNGDFSYFLGKPFDIPGVKSVLENGLPAEKRRQPAKSELDRYAANGIQGASLKAYETFLQEMSPMKDMLENWFNEDLNMFRTKVHGIKGASKQLGMYELAEQAEIMEMAAKADHRPFIKDHLNSFIRLLDKNLDEIDRMIRKHSDKESAEENEVPVDESFRMLKEAFDNYDMGGIEKALEALKGPAERNQLNVNQQSIYNKAQSAYNELDYEAGSALFADSQ